MSSEEPQRHQAFSNEEQPLLRQIGRNAYRILGLPADASSRAISERGAALQRAARAGIQRLSPWNLDWYGPHRRDEIAVSDALGRLSNPRQRLRERLFWFAQSETFVANIPVRKLDASVESLRGSHSSQNCHDAAVLALIACFLHNPTVTNPERWERMLGMWVDALECEDFWSEFFDTEESGDFEPAATPEDVEDLRANSFELITEPIAELARAAANRKDFHRCNRALEVIRSSKLPVEIVYAVEESVLGSYEDALSRLCEAIRTWAIDHIQQDRSSAHLNEEPFAMVVSRWENEVEPKYNVFVAMAGIDSVAGLRASDDYARLVENLAYARGWANKWSDAESLLAEAREHLTNQSPAWERIEGSLRDFAKSAAKQRLEQQTQAEGCSQRTLPFEAIAGGQEDASGSSVQSDQESTAEPVWIQQSRNLAGFCDLCSSLQSKCWETLASRYAGSTIQRVAVLAAWNEYKSKVKPWLNLILASYRGDVHVVKPIQNAAAACLNSLSRAFLLVNELKGWLRREVIAPLQNPELYEKYRIGIPNGILFYGPPGCGKTHIARHLAEELEYYFEEIKPSDVVSPYIHSTVIRIRELFDAAIEKAPSAVFIDEFDAFAPSRSELGGHQQYKAEEVNEFLANLEGIANRKVLVIAATNEPEKIDPAVRRSGRFDKLVFIPPPDAQARTAMLQHHLTGRPLASELDISGIAAVLDGYSASDLKLLVDEAARLALQLNASISTEALLNAMQRVPPSISTLDQERYSAFRARGF